MNGGNARWGKLVTSTKKAGILILSSVAGTAAGYPIFFFVSVGLWVLYGDNARPPELLTDSLFYGIFGITTLIGFAVGFYIVKKREE
jgi:hypothetical protein